MGRRGSFRGRPGILTIILFAVCLTIFYLSWKLLISRDAKDVDSVQMKSSFDYSNQQKEKISKTNEQVVSDSYDQRKDSSLGNALTSKKYAAPLFQQYEATDNKELSTKSVVSKDSIETPESRDMKSSPADVQKLYRQPDNSIVKTVTSMERYVHLDLKGAPPNMHYLQLFIRLIKRLGATGLLVEYEDMFPYTGMLEHIRANNAYSKENIRELVKYAESAGLAVMPLIPTFGHMEFVLKSKFSSLRESDYIPQVIDITQNASYALISEMIKQILNNHPGASRLHIGCDEVYELGRGASSTEMQRRNLSVSQMFLQHVLRVANIVKEQVVSVTPVIWDDELRQIPSQDLKDSGLSSVVEIMVWQYSTDVPRFISKDVWDKYARVFKTVWIASSFKGSTGAGQIFTEPKHHLSNHLSWLDVIAAYNNRLTFQGIVLTGWQRYDHFSTLCELLPVAVPSLAVCLATMVKGGFTKDIHVSTSKLIDCKHPIKLNLPKSHHNVAYNCMFPGYEVYYAVKELYKLIVSGPDTANLVGGWLSDYQVAHAFSSPGQLKVLTRSLTEQSSSYYQTSVSLKRSLIMIYTEDTVDEWIEENIQQRIRHISLLQGKIRSLQQNRSWPRRPLLPVVAVREIAHNVDSANRENSYRGHQFEFDINMLPASQIVQSQSAQPVILTKSIEKYTDDKIATVSQNQHNQFQEKSLSKKSDQKKTFVSYKTPHTSYDFENTHKNRVTRNVFADNTIEMPYLRSKDSSERSGVIFGRGDTVSNNSLYTLGERQGDNSSMDKNITFVQNNVR